MAEATPLPLPATARSGSAVGIPMGSRALVWLTGGGPVYARVPAARCSLPSDRVSALTTDGRGSLWVRMQDEGAARVRVSQHGAMRYVPADKRTSSFCAAQEMPDGRTLIAFCGGSVALFDPRSGVIEDRA